jgi:hypothetical protein
MKLIDIASKLDEITADTFICAKRPWNQESDILLVPFTDDFRIPQDVRDKGFEYFLEIDTVNEILEGFTDRLSSAEKICDFIIYYAENDAIPEWAEGL